MRFYTDSLNQFMIELNFSTNLDSLYKVSNLVFWEY